MAGDVAPVGEDRLEPVATGHRRVLYISTARVYDATLALGLEFLNDRDIYWFHPVSHE